MWFFLLGCCLLYGRSNCVLWNSPINVGKPSKYANDAYASRGTYVEQSTFLKSLAVFPNGVLDPADATWKDIIEHYGTVNGRALIKRVIINEADSFTKHAMDAAIEVINRKKIAAISGDFSYLLALAAHHLEIPYFMTSTVPVWMVPSLYHIRMIPDTEMYTRAIRDLFEHYRWTSAGLLYDTHNGAKITAMLMEHLRDSRNVFDITAYDISKNYSADYVRWVLKDLRKKGATNFLVICSPFATDIILTQALYLSLLSRPNGWIVVNLDSGDIEIEKFIDSRANLTLLRLMVDPSSPQCALNKSEISLKQALYYDVFNLVNGTQREDNNVRKIRFDLQKRVETISINGCTGNLNFTTSGKRNETFLQMIALEGLISGASGTWRSGPLTIGERVRPSKTYSAMLAENNDIFGDKILRITTLIEPPFIQWKNKSHEEGLKMGNDKFEGFCIDIIDEISKQLNFKFNITLVPDGKFGSFKQHNKRWTGMIRELIEDKADVALAPFSITPERSEAVDFTKPFMTKGTSVVVRKPERSVWPFQFLSPLSILVWVAIFMSFIFVGLFLFGVTRITNDAKTDFKADLRDSLWYVWGTLIRADIKGSPVAMSGRILSATWWFFSLIIISIYTANLAAFLTISNAHIPISSAADLAGQDEYNYGTVEDGQIESFFNHSKISHYQQMRAYMMVYNPKSKVKRVEQGFQRALTEKYAFIWDSPTVRHATANNCDLMEIGTPFDLKGYGIATQKNSKYSEHLSMAVLNLNDNGILYRLEGKWWRRPNCPDPRSNAKSKEIEMEVASGMFIVLLGGIVLSAIVFVIHLITKKKCKKCREYFETSEQDLHNHVTASREENVDETTAVLSRTLSIAENGVNFNRWSNSNACVT